MPTCRAEIPRENSDGNYEGSKFLACGCEKERTLLRRRERQATDGAFADAAEVEIAFVLDHVGDLGEALAGWVLKVSDDLAVRIQSQRECIAFDVGLEEGRQAPDDLPEKRMW